MCGESIESPIISVIIPVYNVEKYLPKCIDSVISQTYKNLEIVLVDDGSSDKCSDICDQYAKHDKRIKVIHKKNEGVNEARITGFRESKGQYITFIDSDDYVSPLYVQTLYEPIRDLHVAMTCVQRVFIINGLQKKDVRPRSGLFDKGGIMDILTTDFLYDYDKNNNAYNLGLCCKMIERGYLDGAMENARGLWIGEDLIANLSIAYRIPSMYILNEFLYFYVQHESQSTRNGSLHAWENQVEQWNRIMELDRNHYLSKQIPYRILMLTQIFVRNNVEHANLTIDTFEQNMGKAMDYDILKRYFINYKYPSLSFIDNVFVRLVRSGRYRILYMLFKLALPVRNIIRAFLKRN